MLKFALLATVEAKSGKENDVEALLAGARGWAQAEPATKTWYAFKLGPSSFGIFDTFEDDAGREAHLQGEIAKALMDKADELLASPPKIEKATILVSK